MKHIKVEMWQANNGEKFESRRECVLYELRLNLHEALDDKGNPNNLDLNSVVDFIARNAEEIDQIFCVYHCDIAGDTCL